MTEYQPGTYVKGTETRRAESPAQAVEALWDGFTLQEEPVTETPEETPAEAPSLFHSFDADPDQGDETTD